jgi:hypothetical protein
MQTQSNSITEKTFDRLYALESQKVQKNGKIHRVQSVQRTKTGVMIQTDFQNFDLKSEEKALNWLIDYPLSIDEQPRAANTEITFRKRESTANEMYQKTLIGSGVMGSVAETLLNNIERIKANADFIPQAKAIQEQADSLIDMAKMEVDMIKSFLKKED